MQHSCIVQGPRQDVIFKKSFKKRHIYASHKLKCRLILNVESLKTLKSVLLFGILVEVSLDGFFKFRKKEDKETYFLNVPI